jgi:hypothetical protein
VFQAMLIKATAFTTLFAAVKALFNFPQVHFLLALQLSSNGSGLNMDDRRQSDRRKEERRKEQERRQAPRETPDRREEERRKGERRSE